MSKEIKNLNKKIDVLEKEIVDDVISNLSTIKDMALDIEKSISESERIRDDAVKKFYRICE
jgi:hypothetical protein